MGCSWDGQDQGEGAPSPPVDDPGDGPLVAAAQGDMRAFAPLYDRYADAVLNYCYYRLGNWPDAEDAAQQIFANVLAGLKCFRDRHDSFRSWLFWIAHNEVVNCHRRRARRQDELLAAASVLADRGPTPESLAVDAEVQRHVQIYLARLSDRQRRVCELRLSGLTGREIAQVLGVSHDAVRKTQSRAIERLRDLMVIAESRKETTDA